MLIVVGFVNVLFPPIVCAVVKSTKLPISLVSANVPLAFGNSKSLERVSKLFLNVADAVVLDILTPPSACNIISSFVESSIKMYVPLLFAFTVLPGYAPNQ